MGIITNPPTKRKKLSGLNSFLYIMEEDNWIVTTQVYTFDSDTCFSKAAENDYIMDSGETIVTDDTGIITDIILAI